MGWFDDNAGQPQAPNQVSAPSGGGSNAYRGDDLRARLTALYQQYFGRAPTARELAQYGDNVDDRYLSSIGTSLQQSAEGQAYHTTNVHNQISGIYHDILGRDPTQAELDAWGSNVTDSDLTNIRQQIANSDEAVHHQQNPHEHDPAPTTPNGGGDDISARLHSGNRDTIIQALHDLATQRGTHPAESSYGTWANYILNGNGESTDSEYFINRVMNNDPEFGGSGSAGSPVPDLLAPWTENFTYDDFKAPTMDDLKASPGFQASLDRASNTLQRSAAAKGSLLSGSTLQALSDQTADLSTQGYGNLFNQNAQTYQTNRGNAFDTYKDREASFYNNQNNAYAKLMGMAALNEQDVQSQRQTGLGYAQLGSNAITGGAAAYNGLLTGGANAAASGVVGQNNAYASLYGSMSQYPAWMLALMRGSSGGGGYGFSQNNYGNS